MSFNDFGSVGTDVAISLYDPDADDFTRIPGITDFSATPMTTPLESHGLEGDDRFAVIYRGWNISFNYDRRNGLMDRYFADREARYRSGAPMRGITITQTIREVNGGVSQYRFVNVELQQDNLGTFNREDKVSGSITGRGSRERVV